ncbi:serine protease [Lentisphaera profundi]|uniref:Serine protease n=1 Tax=Lentisphaera profundi TaxID=1658616 RepID=A0ABY7VXC4_9BACT|nr:serine protease [Lentisphaera profundi]WDE98566.1 serine protease [Lentisphaera profundi]
MKFIFTLFIFVLLSACTSLSENQDSHTSTVLNEPVLIIDDIKLRGEFEKKMTTLFKEGTPSTHEKLQQELSRKTCKLELPSAGILNLTPAEIYQHRVKSTVMVGVLYNCKSKTCKKIHSSIASGVIIHEDGIVVTNYHVVDSKQTNLKGMGVMTADGHAFLVDEVLAADKVNDIAILKLKAASDLTAVPISRDEPVGNSVTLITHPMGKFYTLTQGYVSRYHVGKDKRCIMNITADYAKGSSGGPVFNNRGDLIGLVSSTFSIAYTNVPLVTDGETKSLAMKSGNDKKQAMYNGRPVILGLNHQMTVKNTVPSRAILKLIEK